MYKRFFVFLAFCFGLSWGSAGLFAALGGRYDSPVGQAFVSLYMLLPMVSVWLTQWVCGERLFSNCGVSFKLNGWWLAAWIGMPLFCIAAALLSGLMPGASLSLGSDLMVESVMKIGEQMPGLGPWGVLGLTLVSGLMAGATVNALFAFGEEVAWRGFLNVALGHLGFWKRAGLIGFVWGLWHAPIILMGHNYPDHRVAGVLMMIAFCMLLAPIFLLIRERSKSVVAAAVAHGSLNATAGLSLVLVVGYNDLLCGPQGLAGMAALLLADGVIFLSTRHG